MKTFAQLHKEKIQAGKIAKNEEPTNLSEYQQLLEKLNQYKTILSKINSIQQKKVKKQEFLKELKSYADEVVSVDAGGQDEILATYLIWSIDCENLEDAYFVFDYALKHDLKLPENIKRDLPNFVIEEIANNAQNKADADKGKELANFLELAKDKNLHDEIRSKAHKAIGIYLQDSDVKESIKHLDLALKYNKNAGCKTLLEKLKKNSSTQNLNEE